MQPPRLVKKKECTRLTWFSVILIAFVFLALFYVLRNQLYNFLAPIKPIDTKVMVIEGWINDFAIEDVYTQFLENKYDLLITTGGPLDNGYLATHFITAADLSRATLIELGMDSTKIISVPRKFTLENRTFQSALALNQWIKEYHSDIKSFNLISLGAHSKRSWLLFQKSMPEKEIGIIAINDLRFDSKKWWKTSIGSRTVITEAIGYFYVCFFM